MMQAYFLPLAIFQKSLIWDPGQDLWFKIVDPKWKTGMAMVCKILVTFLLPLKKCQQRNSISLPRALSVRKA